MKHVINGIMMSAIAFMVIAAVMIISGRSVRKNELEKALEHAAEQTIESVKVKPKFAYTIMLISLLMFWSECISKD